MPLLLNDRDTFLDAELKQTGENTLHDCPLDYKSPAAIPVEEGMEKLL